MATPTSAASAARPRVFARRRGPWNLLRSGLLDLATRGRLVRHMVGADLKRTHANSVFGQLWWILDPLLQMAIYTTLVTLIFRRAVPDYPLFIFAAILPWKWFSTTLSDASLSVTGHYGLIKQIQFPKLILPAASAVAGIASFAFGLVALGLLLAIYNRHVGPWLLALPLVAAVQFVFTLALAIPIAAANAFYRDVQNVVQHLLRLWFYLSPTLYSLDQIEAPTLRQVLALNPFSAILESYRDVVFRGQAPDAAGLAVVLVVSLALLVPAIVFFKRVEPSFAKIL